MARGDNTCGIAADGSLWCVDSADYAPDNAVASDPNLPIVKLSAETDWSSVAPGPQRHTCAIKTDGTAWCWGFDGSGETGISPPTDGSPTNASQVGASSNWSQIGVGFSHSCGLQSTGTIWCWGSNQYGQLGSSTNVGTSNANPNPSQVGTDTDWIGLTVGVDDTCGVKANGTAWCWGANYYGALGNGASESTLPYSATPVQVVGTGWRTVSTGQEDTCGVKTNGELWCWGDNFRGQLGSTTDNGNYVDHPTPARVGTATDWTSVAVNGSHTCARKSDGSLWCWGANSHGQLGNANNNGHSNEDTANPVPTEVGAATDWSTVTTGFWHTCGLKADGTAWCWGWDNSGQLGSSTAGKDYYDSNPTPVRFGF